MNQLFSTHKSMQVVQGKNFFLDHVVVGKLGAGNSTVYSIRKVQFVHDTYSKNNEDELAMKEIVIKNQQDYDAVMREISLLKDLSQHNHENIIHYFDSCILLRESEFESLRLAYIILEKALTSLAKIIEMQQMKNKYFPIETIKHFMRKLIAVHKFLQDLKIAHCDIKPENILIANLETLDPKICDIGCGKVISNINQTSTISGTIPFLSPELSNNLSQQRINHNPFKSDVYSLGLCFIYLITFQKFTTQQRMRICKGGLEDIINEWINYAEIISENDPLIVPVLQKMLVTNDRERLDFVQLQEFVEEQEQIQFQTKSHTMLDLRESQFEEHSQLSQSKFMTQTKSGFLCQPSATKKNNRHFFKANSKLSGSTHVKNSSNIFSKQNFLVGKPSDSQSPQRKFSLKPNQNLGVPAILTNRKGSILTLPGSSRNLEHLQTQQAWSPSSTKTVHKKASSMNQIKLAPIDMKSLQSTKSTLFDSPIKKSSGSNFMFLQNTYVIQKQSQLKEIIEKIDNFQSNFNRELIIFGDDELILFDLVRLTETTSLSYILLSDNKDSLRGFIDQLGHFHQIQSLELNLSLHNFTGKECRKLPMQLLKLKQLLNLQIILENCTGEANGFLKNWINQLMTSKIINLSIQIKLLPDIGFLSECSHQMQNLQSLELSFHGIQIEEASHKLLFDQTSKLNSLNQLVISFLQCELMHLKQTRWNFNAKLSTLSLSYDQTQLNQGFSALILSVESLVNLKTLSLSFKQLNTTNQYIKLLFEYVRRISNLQELSICLDDIEALDDQINHFICEKLKDLQQLQILQIHELNTRITEVSHISFFSLAQLLYDRQNFMHFEHSGPRVASSKILEDIKEERAPIGFLMKILYINIENITIHLRSFKRISEKIDQLGFQLEQMSNKCSMANSQNFGTFQCLDCIIWPSHELEICLPCVLECHHNHHIVQKDILSRPAIGPNSRNLRCNCKFESCTSIKSTYCSSLQGKVKTYPRICLTCQTDYMCSYCSQEYHADHERKCFQYLQEFKCLEKK